MVSFLDRLFFSTLNTDKTMNGMPIASSQYWNMVYGGTPEEVLQDNEKSETLSKMEIN